MKVPAPPLYGFTGTAVQEPGAPGTDGGPLDGGTLVGGVVGGVVGVVVGGEVVGGEVVGVTAPVHATPFTVNAVGDGFEPVHEPLKPKLALPLVAIEPL
jgi:hypothetical protein